MDAMDMGPVESLTSVFVSLGGLVQVRAMTLAERQEPPRGALQVVIAERVLLQTLGLTLRRETLIMTVFQTQRQPTSC